MSEKDGTNYFAGYSKQINQLSNYNQFEYNLDNNLIGKKVNRDFPSGEIVDTLFTENGPLTRVFYGANSNFGREVFYEGYVPYKDESGQVGSKFISYNCTRDHGSYDEEGKYVEDEYYVNGFELVEKQDGNVEIEDVVDGGYDKMWTAVQAFATQNAKPEVSLSSEQEETFMQYCRTNLNLGLVENKENAQLPPTEGCFNAEIAPEA